MLKDLYPDIEVGGIYIWKPRSPGVVCPECGHEWFDGYPYGETVKVRITGRTQILNALCICGKWAFKRDPGQWYFATSLIDGEGYWIPGIQLEKEV